MNRILRVLTVIALLVMFALPAMAERREDTEKLTFINKTGDSQHTAVTTIFNAQQQNAYIAPGKHRIVSFEVCDLGNNELSTTTETMAALYDASSVGTASDKNVEGEVESDDGETRKLKYDRPLKLANGCVIGQGAYTCVTLEYERYSP